MLILLLTPAPIQCGRRRSDDSPRAGSGCGGLAQQVQEVEAAESQRDLSDHLQRGLREQRGPGVERDAVHLDAGEVQQVADEARLRFGLVADVNRSEILVVQMRLNPEPSSRRYWSL